MASDEPGPGPSQGPQPGAKGGGSKDEAGDWHCCSTAGAGTDGPGGTKWGPDQSVCGGLPSWLRTSRTIGTHRVNVYKTIL